MSEALIRAQIKTDLEAVSGIGVVHGRERFSRSIAEYFSIMTSSAKINGWVIHRQSTGAKDYPIGHIEREYKYAIHGLYEIDDLADSETAVQALVEAIFTKFAGDRKLGGTAQSSELLQVDSIDTDELGGRLFHIVDLSIVVTERT
jgi:hypothetical protein